MWRKRGCCMKEIAAAILALVFGALPLFGRARDAKAYLKISLPEILIHAARCNEVAGSSLRLNWVSPIIMLLIRNRLD